MRNRNFGIAKRRENNRVFYSGWVCQFLRKNSIFCFWKSFAESQIFFKKVDFSNFWLFFSLDQVESFRMIPISWVNSTANHCESLLKNSKKKNRKKFFFRDFMTHNICFIQYESLYLLRNDYVMILLLRNHYVIVT